MYFPSLFTIYFPHSINILCFFQISFHHRYFTYTFNCIFLTIWNVFLFQFQLYFCRLKVWERNSHWICTLRWPAVERPSNGSKKSLGGHWRAPPDQGSFRTTWRQRSTFFGNSPVPDFTPPNNGNNPLKSGCWLAFSFSGLLGFSYKDLFWPKKLKVVWRFWLVCEFGATRLIEFANSCQTTLHVTQMSSVTHDMSHKHRH